MRLCSKQVSGDPGQLDGGQTQTEIIPRPPCVRRQQSSEALKCPRCSSTNTKFCYYNNYNRSQPRHFCKSCKRHWTKGGTLRNVPVGGSRKNKRPKVSSNTSTTTVQAQKYGSNEDNQKIMANILYQALLHETANGRIGTNSVSCAGSSVPQNPSPEFEFASGLSTVFEMNAASLFLTSHQTFISSYDCSYGGNFVDSIEESTITSVDMNASSGSTVPWPSPDTSSALDLPDYWRWNEIEALTSADLNASWDDGKTKP